ncbi:hypothetical protein D3C77_179460 [compost metagenome]
MAATAPAVSAGPELCPLCQLPGYRPPQAGAGRHRLLPRADRPPSRQLGRLGDAKRVEARRRSARLGCALPAGQTPADRPDRQHHRRPGDDLRRPEGARRPGDPDHRARALLDQQDPRLSPAAPGHPGAQAAPVQPAAGAVHRPVAEHARPGHQAQHPGARHDLGALWQRGQVAGRRDWQAGPPAQP